MAFFTCSDGVVDLAEFWALGGGVKKGAYSSLVNFLWKQGFTPTMAAYFYFYQAVV